MDRTLTTTLCSPSTTTTTPWDKIVIDYVNDYLYFDFFVVFENIHFNHFYKLWLWWILFETLQQEVKVGIDDDRSFRLWFILLLLLSTIMISLLLSLYHYYFYHLLNNYLICYLFHDSFVSYPFIIIIINNFKIVNVSSCISSDLFYFISFLMVIVIGTL